MYGAILGDMIGSPYEFDKGKKTKDFPMFIDVECQVKLTHFFVEI